MSDLATDPSGLRAWLSESVARGFLTDQVERHIHIGAAFTRHIPPHASWVDLGSGGGVPGLVVGSMRPDSHGYLLDAAQKRCKFLREAITGLNLTYLEVLEGRAEVIARRISETAEVVIARSFAAPAITAEIASRMLILGGRLIVSEPPEPAPERWPETELHALGLQLERVDDQEGDVHLAIIQKVQPTPERYPRREGKPTKSPLW